MDQQSLKDALFHPLGKLGIYITLLSGVIGMIGILLGVYQITFAFLALIDGQLFIVPFGDLTGTRKTFSLGFIVFLFGLLNAYLSIAFYNLKRNSIPLIICTFIFLSIISIPTLIGPIFFIYPLWKLYQEIKKVNTENSIDQSEVEFQKPAK